MRAGKDLKSVQVKLDSFCAGRGVKFTTNHSLRVHMQRSEQGYLRVPRRLVSDRSMRSSDVRVFAVLMDLCTSAKEIDDGLETLAERTGLTKRTVCEVLARLEERGFISRESRRGPYTGLIRLNSSSEQFVG